jgi:uncharacterized membrane protein
MNRGTGSGLIGLGVVLAVAGAIMRYAITTDSSSFDMFTAGGILLLVGIVAAIIGLILVLMSGRRSTTQREQIVSTPTGSERVTEQEGWTG